MISRLEEWLDDGVGPCYGMALSLDLARSLIGLELWRRVLLGVRLDGHFLQSLNKKIAKE